MNGRGSTAGVHVRSARRRVGVDPFIVREITRSQVEKRIMSVPIDSRASR